MCVCFVHFVRKRSDKDTKHGTQRYQGTTIEILEDGPSHTSILGSTHRMIIGGVGHGSKMKILQEHDSQETAIKGGKVVGIFMWYIHNQETQDGFTKHQHCPFGEAVN